MTTPRVAVSIEIRSFTKLRVRLRDLHRSLRILRDGICMHRRLVISNVIARRSS